MKAATSLDGVASFYPPPITLQHGVNDDDDMQRRIWV
jgi:hypothetical protein